MEYLLKALNAQPGLRDQPSGTPFDHYEADQLVLPSLELEVSAGPGRPTRGSLDDLILSDVECSSLKTETAARQIGSRVRILQHNLEQITLNQVKLESQLLELVGQTWSSGLRDKTARGIESDWLALERDKRMELVACWRDLRDLEFAFINYNSEAKTASSLAEMTGEGAVVPTDRPEAFVPGAAAPPAGYSSRVPLGVPSHGLRNSAVPGRVRNVSPLEARLG